MDRQSAVRGDGSGVTNRGQMTFKALHWIAVVCGDGPFEEGTTAYKQRRKSNLQQVEIMRWLLLVSCLGQIESS